MQKTASPAKYIAECFSTYTIIVIKDENFLSNDFF